jgi:hypothetical protein
MNFTEYETTKFAQFGQFRPQWLQASVANASGKHPRQVSLPFITFNCFKNVATEMVFQPSDPHPHPPHLEVGRVQARPSGNY